MGGKDLNYQIVYRRETLQHYVPGGWVFFQRLKKYGGGFWLGRTYEGVFILEQESPISLHEGIIYINLVLRVEARADDFDDEQFGLPF